MSAAAKFSLIYLCVVTWLFGGGFEWGPLSDWWWWVALFGLGDSGSDERRATVA